MGLNLCFRRALVRALAAPSPSRTLLSIFAGAKLVIGGEGSRYEVETKARADRSLPSMFAAALIDREMTNDDYDPNTSSETTCRNSSG